MGSNRIESLLLQRLPAAVVVGDRDGRVVYYNHAAAELYGCEVGGPLPRELALAVREGKEWAGDVSFLGRRLHCRAAPVYDSARNLVGCITVSFPRTRNTGAAETLRDLGERISQARTAAGLTQQELADQLGVTRRSVQGYEAGRVAPYRHLDRLATVLGRPRSWFLREADDRSVLREVRRIVREEIEATP